jgi:hypothetical protein
MAPSTTTFFSKGPTASAWPTWTETVMAPTTAKRAMLAWGIHRPDR